MRTFFDSKLGNVTISKPEGLLIPQNPTNKSLLGNSHNNKMYVFELFEQVDSLISINDSIISSSLNVI